MSSYISFQELAKHNKAGDIWISLYGKVYNVSEFKDHPGSYEMLINNAGKEATQDFEDQNHPETAKKKLEEFYIGDLVDDEESESEAEEKKKDGVADVWPILVFMAMAVGIMAFILYQIPDKRS